MTEKPYQKFYNFKTWGLVYFSETKVPPAIKKLGN
jgi:hypothetical protein